MSEKEKCSHEKDGLLMVESTGCVLCGEGIFAVLDGLRRERDRLLIERERMCLLIQQQGAALETEGALSEANLRAIQAATLVIQYHGRFRRRIAALAARWVGSPLSDDRDYGRLLSVAMCCDCDGSGKP